MIKDSTSYDSYRFNVQYFTWNKAIYILKIAAIKGNTWLQNYFVNIKPKSALNGENLSLFWTMERLESSIINHS